jgi:hypothetical protein
MDYSSNPETRKKQFELDELFLSKPGPAQPSYERKYMSQWIEWSTWRSNYSAILKRVKAYKESPEYPSDCKKSKDHGLPSTRRYQKESGVRVPVSDAIDNPVEYVAEMPQDTITGKSQKKLAEKIKFEGKSISVKSMLTKAQKYFENFKENPDKRKILLKKNDEMFWGIRKSDMDLFKPEKPGPSKNNN